MATADCIVIQGSNMAECHPVGFQWVTEAKARGAKVIHVDPRFTRTTAVADKHVPIRVGSDIVLLGGLIRHVLENYLYFDEYVRTFTNASTILGDDFADTEDLDGLFSGYDPDTGTYDTQTWAYADADGSRRGVPPTQPAEQDPTLQDPRCVFQVLKRHYSRYTPEMVEEVCGISAADFAYLADVFVIDGQRGHGLGKRLVKLMVDDGPGSGFRWTLFTSDAHGLYRLFGFAAPDDTALVRPAR